MADQGFELRLPDPKSVLLTTVAFLPFPVVLQAGFHISVTFSITTLGFQWNRKMPTPCSLQTFEKRKSCHMSGSILEYSAMCTFSIAASPQISCFISRRRGRCWLSCGSWPFWRGTPYMYSIHSVPSSCTTGKQGSLTASGKVVVAGLCWAWDTQPLHLRTMQPCYITL